MSVEIIQQRLLRYQPQTVLEQENALKEIMQEIALLALSRSGFFRVAAFQDGTCLRIIYGSERFSEDLDFVLKESDKNFSWDKYIKNMQEEFKTYGYLLEVNQKNQLNKVAKSTFLKADSIGGILVLNDLRTHRTKLKIKLEIDSNPPEGSSYELKYLDFPAAFSVQTQDLPSLFASKSHALLYRDYVKGRDWFDFVWYIARQVPINFQLLNSALKQTGPWKDTVEKINKEWFINELKNKINKIDWIDTKKDIAQFLRPKELASLEVWSRDFFISRLDKLATYL